MSDERTEQQEDTAVNPYLLNPPVTVTPALKEALEKLFAPFQYVLSEDGSQILEWRALTPIPSDEEAAAAVSAVRVNWTRAMRVSMMAKSDEVAIRAFKAGVAFPADWQTFTVALRNWPETPDQPIPTEPDMPANI